MHWVAWKMLTGDRAKYLGTVFGVAFGVLLISQQTSIFVGIISRTASQVLDVREPDFWVMDPYTQDADDIKPGYPTLVELRQTTGYEGDAVWIAGLSGPACVRVSIFSSPARLVVDVAPAG